MVAVLQSLPAAPVPVARTVRFEVPVGAAADVVIVSRVKRFPVDVPVSVGGAKVATAPAGKPVTVIATVQLPLPLKRTCTELLASVP